MEVSYLGVTREYPTTPKVTLERVDTWLRSYVAAQLRGYAATRLRGYAATWLLTQIQNINGRLIPTAEVTSLIEQTTKARITEIYLFFKKQIFARYFGLQYKPSSGAKQKRKVRNIKGSLQRRFKI